VSLVYGRKLDDFVLSFGALSPSLMPLKSDNVANRVRKTLDGITIGGGAQKARSIPDGYVPSYFIV